MVLESTMICVDNSDYMRNGDFMPTRLQAQQDAVNLVCLSKTRSNPENNVGLITLATTEVLTTLTSDVGKILAKVHSVVPNGNLNFMTGIRIAQLALKHRQGKNHKMRIVAFVGSPIKDDEKELVKLGKRLKKEKVNVDVVLLGEETDNSELVTAFINALNGKDGNLSHMVAMPPGPHLADALISSPVLQNEDGTAPNIGGGFEFGIDPNDDPELALALRVSMEEQRAREGNQAGTSTGLSTVGEEASGTVSYQAVTPGLSEEEQLLQRALAMSMEVEGSSEPGTVEDFRMMSEEDQIALAMRMSLAELSAPEAPGRAESEEGMEVDADTEESDLQQDDDDGSGGPLDGLPLDDTRSCEMMDAIEKSRSEAKKLKEENDAKAKKNNKEGDKDQKK